MVTENIEKNSLISKWAVYHGCCVTEKKWLHRNNTVYLGLCEKRSSQSCHVIFLATNQSWKQDWRILFIIKWRNPKISLIWICDISTAQLPVATPGRGMFIPPKLCCVGVLMVVLVPDANWHLSSYDITSNRSVCHNSHENSAAHLSCNNNTHPEGCEVYVIQASCGGVFRHCWRNL